MRDVRTRSSSACANVGRSGDVRHERQRLIELGQQRVQPNRRRIEAAAGRERGAEEIDRVRQLERGARAGALVEHVGGQVGDAELSGRIGRAARLDDERDVDHRHFVHFHDPDRQAVRQRPLLNRRQLQRRRRTGRGRLRSIGRRLLGAE